jgi:hypothetical protein
VFCSEPEPLSTLTAAGCSWFDINDGIKDGGVDAADRDETDAKGYVDTYK